MYGKTRSSIHSAYLGYHHMAIKSAFPTSCFRTLNMLAYLCHNRGSKGHVRHEVSIHHVHMKPICSMVYSVRTCGA